MAKPSPTLTIYLSPHLDDAVLSCGGRIAREGRTGRSACIVTVFAGDAPDAATAGAADADCMPNRRAEDQRANALVGADYRHWPFPEAAYRRDTAAGQALYPEMADLFGDVHPSDEDLVREVAAWINDLSPEASIVAPLGAGGHVDHHITRRAAELARGLDLTYYEDFPYAQKWGALAKLLRPRTTWRSSASRVTAADLDLKCLAISAHQSQTRVLFKDQRDLRRKVFLYAFRRRGERYWHRLEAADFALPFAR